MPILKRVRVIKKIQEGGAWRFVSLKRSGKRYVWDPRPGSYYLEWWAGGFARWLAIRQARRSPRNAANSSGLAEPRRNPLRSSRPRRSRDHRLRSRTPTRYSWRTSGRTRPINPRPCDGTGKCPIILSA